MSHYQPYPAYKDSGVEWLGRVPEHWQATTISRLFEIKAGGDLKEEYYSDEFDDVHCHPIYTNSTKLDAVYGYTSKPLYLANTITVTGRGEIGHAVYRDHIYDAIIRLLVLSPRKGGYCKYAAYFINSMLSFHGGSTAVSQLSAEQISPYLMLYPPLEEQAGIANYLDRETARIDALIEKKTRFIELLREKTLSLIGRAFECAESRWIRLQHVCDVVSRPVGHEEDKSYVRLGIYNRGRGIFKKEETDAEDMGDSDFFWIESGDLILSGQFAWEGAVALADVEHESCVVSHRYPVIRGRAGEVLTEYLFAFFLSHYGDFLLNDCSRGSAGRNRPLNIVSLLKWKIPVPPMELQEEVASLVRYRRELLRKVETSIDLLKERRSALITAAVTGQIDLREAVAV